MKTMLESAKALADKTGIGILRAALVISGSFQHPPS